MTSHLFSKRVKAVLSSIVSFCLIATSTLGTVAHAQTAPCSAYAADKGQDTHCSAVRVGGIPVSFPKLDWEFVSDMATAPTPGSATVLGGNQAVSLANRTALALGLEASDIANAATVFPSNVPYIFARYNPYSGTLNVDIFKLEKTTVAGQVRSGLYHATFGPSHGDRWKANRSYISPDAFKTGMTAGVNPFSSFMTPGSDQFSNISLSAAQVAVGHAMRLAGAPLALMSVADSRLSQQTKKSGGLFTKKTETFVYAHTKSRWFIAQPSELLARSSTLSYASFCAADPTRTDCPSFATAVSGVGFEEFEGGTLSDFEEKFQVDYQKKSGLSFLGALVLAVVGSFAIAGIMAAAGVGLGAAGAAGATAVGTSGAAAGTAMGTFGSMLVNVGGMTAFSSLGTAIAVETAFTAASMALIGGANLGSVIVADPLVFLGTVTVAKGTFELTKELNKYEKKINDYVMPRVQANIARVAGKTESVMPSVSQTINGDCLPGSKLKDCVGSSGVVPRIDQYQEHNLVNFVRDNQGAILRNGN